MSLTKMKAQTQSRYIDAVTKIQQQSNISLQKWDTADNIDLYMIFFDYQKSYQQKFNKPPKLVKKVQDTKYYQQMKKVAMKQKQINSTINKNNQTSDASSKHIDQSKPPMPTKHKKNSTDGFQIRGTNTLKNQSTKQDNQDLFDVRVLKGIPDYSDVPQYRQLAAYLQRDILIQNPNVKFQDVVGLDDAKRLLKQAVSLPLKYPHLFTGILQPWRGVLLFGPPGTGKTMLAKSVATQCKTTFFNISASSVVSKWRGQSQKLIRVLFQLARFYQPSTIFIDQIDSIMSQRSTSGAQHQGSRRMKTQLLIQMDGIVKKKQNVFILAASNLPWDLDIAMLRRLQKRILVDLPCMQARKSMVKMYLPPQRADSIDYQTVAQLLQGYSGSDIHLVCKQAAMKPLRRLLIKLQQVQIKQQKNNRNKVQINLNKQDIPQPQNVKMDDVLQSIKTTKKSPGLIVQKYKKWVQQFGSL